jgi:hypothetical protein
LQGASRRPSCLWRHLPTKSRPHRSYGLRLLMKKLLIVVTALAGVSLMAQTPSDDEDIKLFRKDLKSLKKQIVAANMDLTDGEAQQFWPVYDRYTAELAAVTDKKYALLEGYAQNYTTMTSEQAESYIKGRAAVEESIMQLRLKYVPIFRKVISGKATALFFQLDWRLGLVMDLQLASQTPLIEP